MGTDVISNSLFGQAPAGFGKVAVCPEAFSPKKFLQLRILLADYVTSAALQLLDDGRYTFGWPGLDVDMDMVWVNG